MIKNVAEKPHGVEPSAAVHAAAREGLLSLIAGALGGSPREVDPSLVVDYECESDEMADSGRLEQSSDRHRATDREPLTEKVQSNRRFSSLFGSDDVDDPPSPVQSPKPSSALISVRDGDDGESHRGESFRGTPA